MSWVLKHVPPSYPHRHHASYIVDIVDVAAIDFINGDVASARQPNHQSYP